MELDKSIGQALRLKRMALGLDRVELASLIGVTVGYIKHIELGIKPLSDNLIEAFDTLSDNIGEQPMDMCVSQLNNNRRSIRETLNLAVDLRRFSLKSIITEIRSKS